MVLHTRSCFRVLRKNDQPFGGIQLILCGDFLQLPPVTKGTEKRKFAFQVSRICIGKILNHLSITIIFHDFILRVKETVERTCWHTSS